MIQKIKEFLKKSCYFTNQTIKMDPKPIDRSKSTLPASGNQVPTPVKFILGGLAGVAGVTITHPLDLVKNRMQMSGEMGLPRQYPTSIHTAYYILKNEGFLAIYKGLSASMLRQATYTTTRLGIFTTATDYIARKENRPPSFAMKLCIGMFAGFCGAFVGTPSDLTMVRMTLDGRLPEEQRRNYRSVFDAMYRIIREEGVTTLWRGCTPTILRAMVANAVQLSTYSQIKRALINTGHFSDNIPTHFTASIFSSFVTTIFSMPMDIAKTRMQQDAGAEYKNVADVWFKIIKYEGPLSLWKGLAPYYIRMAPQTTFMFVFLEELTRLYVKYVLKAQDRPTVF